MQGVLLFAFFFCFLSENNHETIISSHCLFPILFGLAELLGEVVGATDSLFLWPGSGELPGGFQADAATWMPGPMGWRGGAQMLGVVGPGGTPPIRDFWEPYFCPVLSPTWQILGTILPWLSLSCSFCVWGRDQSSAPPMPDRRGCCSVMLSKGGHHHRGLYTYTRRKRVHAGGTFLFFHFVVSHSRHSCWSTRKQTSTGARPRVGSASEGPPKALLTHFPECLQGPAH